MFFFALWAKEFLTSDVNITAVFSNLRCTCSEEVFGRKFSYNKTFFNFYSDFEQNVSRLSAVFFGLAFRNFHFSFLEQNVGVKTRLKKKVKLFLHSFVRGVFALQTNGLSQFSHNCLKTVSKSFQYVSIHFLCNLSMSDFERTAFGKNGISIILPVQKFVWGQRFFLEKKYKLVIFLFFFALSAKNFHTLDVNV